MDWATWGPIISQGVSAAGQIAASRNAAKAGARQDQFVANQTQDNFAQRNYGQQQDAMLTAGSMAEAARLARAKLGIEAPETRTRQAMWADIIGNVQDAKVNGLPSHIPRVSVSGGLRPSLLGPGARQAAQGLSTQALTAMMSGSDVPEMPDFSSMVMAPPASTPQPEAGAEDKWNNILAMLGQFAQGANTVNQMRQGARPQGAV
jgi:hypothetical protein